MAKGCPDSGSKKSFSALPKAGNPLKAGAIPKAGKTKAMGAFPNTGKGLKIDPCPDVKITVRISFDQGDCDINTGLREVTVNMAPDRLATVRVFDDQEDLVAEVLESSTIELLDGTYTWTATPADQAKIGGDSSGELVVATCEIEPPEAPVALAATEVLDTSFVANWEENERTDSYRLDVSQSSVFFDFVPGFEDLDVGDATSFSVEGLDFNTKYHYRVRAVNSAGTSPNSNVIELTTQEEIIIPPDAPVALTATNVDFESFQANWEDTANTDSYRLDVATDSEFTSFVAGFEDLNVGDVLFEEIINLDPETAYFYRVRAVNSAGTSPNSNTIQVTTEEIPTPEAPTALDAEGEELLDSDGEQLEVL